MIGDGFEFVAAIGSLVILNVILVKAIEINSNHGCFILASVQMQTCHL